PHRVTGPDPLTVVATAIDPRPTKVNTRVRPLPGASRFPSRYRDVPRSVFRFTRDFRGTRIGASLAKAIDRRRFVKTVEEAARHTLHNKRSDPNPPKASEVDGRPTDAACEPLMEFVTFKTVWISVKRNFVSVIFPTIAALTIYADLKRTARWKRQLAEEQNK
ncbi:PREDICTED: uncharacterized protein LOC105455508, partial [Wasmannia auropunctata]|uniref:uncharacterized protein LOC105455508 n=1 Tax=Wasmannia auropunctata TaxID=64793 RepID=UPI0005EEAEB1